MIARPIRHSRARGQVAMPPGFPPIVRPHGLGRAAQPAAVPEPQHHHLPAWVRRAHAQARPILGDLLAGLSGDSRAQLEQAVRELTDAVSAGKFSQSFRYSDVIAMGMRLLEDQRRENAAAARAQRALESARRRVSEQLRDSAAQLAPEVGSRLGRSLRSAVTTEDIAAIGRELDQALGAARSVQERRRDREIHRTRSRIERTAAKGGGSGEPAEDWQDVLRRLQEEMTASGTP